MTNTNKGKQMENKTNGQKQMEKIFNIRVRQLQALEAQLIADPKNVDLETQVIGYRAFVAKEKLATDKVFAKMGWVW